MTDRREGNLAKRNLLIAVQARRRPFPPFCAVFARSCTVESPQKSPQNLRVRYRPQPAGRAHKDRALGPYASAVDLATGFFWWLRT